MSEQAAQLLEAFEALPDAEMRVFTVELLGREAPFDSGPWTTQNPQKPPDEILNHPLGEALFGSALRTA